MNSIKEKIMRGVFFAAAMVSAAAVLLICLFLFAHGIPAVHKAGAAEFFFGTNWSPSDVPPSFGIFPMILGSIYITAGAALFGLPLGILTAVFLAKYCPKNLHRILKPATDLLAGIPSIIYGFFGLTAIVPAVRTLFGGSGCGILSALLLLGIMILPTVTGVCEAALHNVPAGCYEGALALGATPERSIFFVVLPAAKSGILASAVLGIGRAAGETMAVITVAGNRARMPGGLFGGVRTLTANIVIEMGYASGLHREILIACGALLLVFILMINLIFAALKK